VSNVFELSCELIKLKSVDNDVLQFFVFFSDWQKKFSDRKNNFKKQLSLISSECGSAVEGVVNEFSKIDDEIEKLNSYFTQQSLSLLQEVNTEETTQQHKKGQQMVTRFVKKSRAENEKQLPGQNFHEKNNRKLTGV
jgi:nitrogenase subunit NifH